MKNTIEKIAQISHTFISNFYSEIEKNQELKDNITKIKEKLSNKTPIYKSLQFSDYLIANALKDYCSTPKKGTNVDKFFEKTFNIPQYYGGVRDYTTPSLLERIFKPFGWFSNLKMYKEYKVLQKIENKIIPEIFKRLFNFKEVENITKETGESLKHLKEYIYNQEKDWTDKEIILDDIRLVETESIKVKNLKKTVKCNFEMSTILSGLSKDKRMNLRIPFNCSIDFINEDGQWVTSNFSFSPFN